MRRCSKNRNPISYVKMRIADLWMCRFLNTENADADMEVIYNFFPTYQMRTLVVNNEQKKTLYCDAEYITDKTSKITSSCYVLLVTSRKELWVTLGVCELSVRM